MLTLKKAPVFRMFGWLTFQGFPGGISGKEPTCQCRRTKRPRFDPWVGKSPWRKQQHPTPVLLAGKSHGQSSLVGYSPRGCKVSHVTRVTSHTAPFRASKCYTRYRASALSGPWRSGAGEPSLSPACAYLHGLRLVHRLDSCLCHGSCCESHKRTTW